jgi:NDP-sugar pyrophosphorylase family protein
MTEPLAGVRVMVQAGGRGERLRTVSGDVPKPMVRVGGVPMVEWMVRRLAAAGARELTVVTGWKGDRIEAHLRALAGLPRGVSISFIREATPRGNAGALAELAGGEGDVLLAFGDLVTTLDFGQLLAVHRARGAGVTLASHHESIRVRLGELVADGEGRVADYLEKPLKQFLICSGIALFRPRVLDLLTPGAAAGLVDVVKTALDQGHRVTHWTHGAFWMDVNTPEDLEQAERALAARPAPVPA